uniref:Uncharacterized protein n=1 Tax=Anguilla anguilla TaxID=7936 RepID=A0A0E9SS63_ANGAN
MTTFLQVFVSKFIQLCHRIHICPFYFTSILTLRKSSCLLEDT